MKGMDAVREGYKRTELGEIPVEWEVSHLGRHMKIIGGYAFKSEHFHDQGIKILRISNISEGKLSFLNCVFYPEKIAKDISEEFFLKENDIVIAMSGATTGKVGMVDKRDLPCLLNQRVGKLKPISNKVDNKFIYYVMSDRYFQEKIWNYAIGGAQPNISGKQIESIPIMIPTLPEQKKIADILSTVDEQIERTEQLIGKTEELKKGLMQKLLTKGIGHTRFKKTEVGEIPEAWEVKRLIEVKDPAKENAFTDGDWIEAEHITDHGIRLIQTGNIGIGKFIEKEDKKYISLKTFADLRCKEVQPGDILICRMAEPAGRSCVVPDLGTKMITSVDCTIVKVDKKKYDNRFINYYLNTERNLKEMQKFEQGTTRKRITRSHLQSIKIPVPPLEEQKEISDILTGVDSMLEIYDSQKQRLQRLKKGLMQKLLTGKIRVKV
ncbi:MAG: hypothetical protein BAA01_11245 [Bacillus thermozeamaize]|uniref:Type I restriction modification DNA specificity domain-containing protein n=1 Tax=Bacillus thermozeamaize TaxID=230954 RepID=A0A1Y3PRX8_9BACI|nr:MAG: hypothetical protein BAA01_11245 [Bacillus thermozeamaize]